MHEIEIAGLKISYRNVSDLNAKVVSLLKGIHRRRVAAETAFESFRRQEDNLRKFLGGSFSGEEETPVPAQASEGNSGA
jgi:hypothetical protein